VPIACQSVSTLQAGYTSQIFANAQKTRRRSAFVRLSTERSRRQSTHLGYKISRAGATVSRSLSEMINSKY
jgi:hypothetical protein